MERRMSNTYEIRAFNQKGNCYSVRTLGNEKEALISFDKLCNKMQGYYDVCKENDLTTSFLAHDYQLVVYNEAMTWLEEIKTWEPA
jgi:hypothetical protein